jgi:hypothetical protein
MAGAAGVLPHMLFGILAALQLRALDRGPVTGALTTDLALAVPYWRLLDML